MSTVADYDLVVYQGMPLAQPFAPEAEDPETNILHRVDYTGHSATFTVWPNPATDDSLHDGVPILSVTDGSGAIQLGLFDGGPFGSYGILLYLTQAQTSLLRPWGEGGYNLDVMNAYGVPVLRIKGTIRLEEGQQHG